MLDSWLPFLIYGFFALAIPLSMIFASFALATRPHRRMRVRTLPFESGVSKGPPAGYNVKFIYLEEEDRKRIAQYAETVVSSRSAG